MRKILSGLFFRLIKGFEIWAIIALLIWASVAIDKILFATSDISAFRNESMNTVYDGNGKESPELLVQERFEHSGMSAYDLRFSPKAEAVRSRTAAAAMCRAKTAGI